MTVPIEAEEPVPSLAQLRRRATDALRAANIDGAELDARVLLAHALGVDAATLLARAEIRVDPAGQLRVARAIARRVAGEPVTRIVGSKEFWSRDFIVTPDVLAPRPETETLVEAALLAQPDRDAELRILDLGVGSGALLAALLIERPRAKGIGVDLSEAALAVARKNLEAFDLGARAHLVRGDWARSVAGPFDLVVANPPYVRNVDIATLAREVREHDPVLALDGGADGLTAYREIVAQLPRLLASGGIAVLELGDGLEPAVAALARSTHMVVNGPARRDLSGSPRAVVLRLADKKTLGRDGEPH